MGNLQGRGTLTKVHDRMRRMKDMWFPSLRHIICIILRPERARWVSLFLVLYRVEEKRKNGLEGPHRRRKNGLALENQRKCDFERYRPCKTRSYSVFRNQHLEKHISTLLNFQKVIFV